MKRTHVLVAGALLLGALPAAAQQQKPPIAVYWLSADTASGLPMGAGGMNVAAMMMGGGAGGPQRSLLLQLGSQRQAAGDPTAAHEIPAAMKMGASLPLVTPKNPPPVREPREDGPPEDFQKPRGRMLIYWGCGEQTRAGQPLVIDFAKMASGQAWPAGLFAVRTTPQRSPAPGRSRTYGDWPNKDDATRVPADASLVGDHAVKGNYAPEIRFAVAERHDFLAPVALEASAKTPGGGIAARWQAIPHALGYFATVMAAADGGNDIVMWSSSETKVFGETLLTWLPNADVARLVKEQVVMPPQTTECVVPAAVAGAGDGGIMRFIAYGDELNLAHPPRPQNPKEVWEPQWAVKLRQKSTATVMLGMDAAASKGRRAGRGATEPARESAGQAPAEAPGDAVIKEGVKALRGVLGF